MTRGDSLNGRALFVIDNDFGALGTVMYLLHGQELSKRSTILLPQRAHELHGARLPVANRPYRSTQDILDIVDAEAPEVVCLFSGYVLALQGVLTIDALGELVRELRRRGCKVATSDPFLGTFHRIAEAELPNSPIPRFLDRLISGVPRAQGRVAGYFRLLGRKRLASHVRRVADILEDVAHVYPVPIDGLEARGSATRVSFFNPKYLRTAEELRRNSDAVSARLHVPGGTRRWLFVLAQFDLEFQERKHGRKGFVDLVARMIRETLKAGRHATFIGPAVITDALSVEFGRNASVSLLPYCAYEEFEQRLLDAEFAFYWQIFSTSSFLRLWNGLPVFFFDPGHNAHLLSALKATGLEYYYLADPPIYLDAARPLDGDSLTGQSAGFGASADESRRRLAHLPAPASMLEAIVDSP